MRTNYKKGQSGGLKRARGRSSELFRGIILQFSDEDIQTIFEFDPMRGFRALDQFRRLEISDWCYRGANRELSYHDVLDAYQITMIEVYLKVRESSNEIRNIVAFTYDVARKRGSDVNRKRFRSNRRVRIDSDLDRLSAPQTDDRDDARWIRSVLDELEGEEAKLAEYFWPKAGPALTEAETAELLEQSQSTVHRRKNALVEKLRRRLLKE